MINIITNAILAANIKREDLAYSRYAQKLKDIDGCATLEQLNAININFD